MKLEMFHKIASQMTELNDTNEKSFFLKTYRFFFQFMYVKDKEDPLYLLRVNLLEDEE